MKIAARFPVKNYPPLSFLLVLFHFLLLLLAWVEFHFSWQLLIIILSLLVSAFYSIKQLQTITQSFDDLCWNGDSWLIQKDEKLKGQVYLQLNPTSWISSHLALLNFSSGGKNFYWLFSRRELGERMYSQLIYLVKQNIKAQQKVE